MILMCDDKSAPNQVACDRFTFVSLLIYIFSGRYMGDMNERRLQSMINVDIVCSIARYGVFASTHTS